MNVYLELFTSFAKVGVMTFGGGYAMLPILQREVSERRRWATEEELIDYYAIGQCTPGVIAVNTATFIGRKQKGITGAITATVGLAAPSIVIITLIAAFLRSFAEYAVVKNAFAGIRACVCVLVINAVVKMWKKSVTDKVALAIFLAVFLAASLLSVSPAIYVILSGALGIIIKKAKEKRA
jgi:chromate transporter